MTRLRELELKLIRAAAEWRREIPGRRTQQTMELEQAIWDLAEYEGSMDHLLANLDQALGPENDPALQYEEPTWITRTWADVRTGDTVRIPGTEHVAYVLSVAARRDWHVHPAANPYHPEENRAEWSEIPMTLDTLDGARRPLLADPAKPIEISLTPAQLAAIETLGGWDNRV